MPTTGKMYFGSTLIAEPGMQWDYTRPFPPDAGTYATWTIPGTLQQTFTTSGTYTPAVGVSTVHVMVLGGGGRGGDANTNNSGQYACGGAGGEMRVYRSVPVSGPVSITVGGSQTSSSFGSLSASAGRSAVADAYAWVIPPSGWHRGDVGSGGHYYPYGAYGRQGRAGCLVNGSYYGGGGAGGYNGGSSTLNNTGGAGGGGIGGANATPPTSGTSGLGGGGGGGENWSNGTEKIGANGGSGRVMIWSEDV